MSYKKLYTYDDFLTFLESGGFTEAARKSKDAYDSALKSELQGIESKKKNIYDTSEDLAREAYISYVSTSKDMPEKLTAKGLNGGAADSVYLSLANEYLKNHGKINRDMEDKLYETEEEMREAKNNNEKEYNSEMASLYKEAISEFLSAREKEEDRNFEGYYNDQKYKDLEADRKLQSQNSEKDRELEKAKLALEAGDAKFLEKLGIKLNTNSSGSSSGSSSSGGANSVLSGQSASDLQKILDYAISLAEFGNYDLLCSITGISEEQAALKFSDKEAGYSESQIRDAARLFMGGDYSNNVIGILREAYPEYTLKQIWNLWKSVAMNEWFIHVSDGYKGPKQ